MTIIEDVIDAGAAARGFPFGCIRSVTLHTGDALPRVLWERYPCRPFPIPPPPPVRPLWRVWYPTGFGYVRLLSDHYPGLDL